MENTKQTPSILDKVRFFAQYYGQNILKINGGQGIIKCVPFWWEKDSFSFLELKPLSKITDEDAVKVIEIFNYKTPINYQFTRKKDAFSGDLFRQVFYENIYEDSGQEGIDNLKVVANFSNNGIHVLESNREKEYWRALDYLRSKGYAVPFMEHSVEDLVSFGWVKLLNE